MRTLLLVLGTVAASDPTQPASSSSEDCGLAASGQYWLTADGTIADADGVIVGSAHSCTLPVGVRLSVLVTEVPGPPVPWAVLTLHHRCRTKDTTALDRSVDELTDLATSMGIESEHIQVVTGACDPRGFVDMRVDLRAQ
jgi:hypothetical protein